MNAAINLLPIIKIVFFLALAGFGLVVLGFVLFGLLVVVTAPFRLLSGSDEASESDVIIVFWGGVILVVVLIVLAFKHGLLTLE
jgi:hypothetical protein